MKALFHPKELLAVISSLTAKVDHLTSQLTLKDARIDGLEQRLAKLEIDSDSQEQYSRRPNLRIQGLPEQGDGTTDDIERSHRLGPKTDREGRPRTRVTIVRFRSERVRDTVFRARTVLKNHNKQHSDAQVYLNEDLTARRASMAFETRKLKQQKKILDCWTATGKVFVKDLTNKIIQISTTDDLKVF